jgi:MFS family permease
LLLILIAAAFITASAQGACAAYALEWYKKGTADAAKAWARGVKHFWRVLIINICRKLFALAIMALFLFCLSYIMDSQAGWLTNFAIALIPGLLFFVYVGIYAVSIFSIGYVVATSAKLPEAVAKGYRMFIEHVLVSLEVGIVLVFLNILAVGAVFLSFFLAFTPSLILWLVAGALSGTPAVLVAVGLFLGIFFWLVFLVLTAGIFNAYNIGVWMHLFVKMHHVGIPSRIVRFLHRIFGRA